MLLMIIVAAIATTAFYRRANSLGLSPGRAASLPFIVVGIFLVIAFLAARLIEYLAVRIPLGDGTVKSIALTFDILMVLGYLIFIRRNWNVLNSAVDRYR